MKQNFSSSPLNFIRRSASIFVIIIAFGAVPASTAYALSCTEEYAYAHDTLLLRNNLGATKIRAMAILAEDSNFTEKEKARMRKILDLVFEADGITPQKLGLKVKNSCLKKRLKN